MQPDPMIIDDHPIVAGKVVDQGTLARSNLNQTIHVVLLRGDYRGFGKPTILVDNIKSMPGWLTRKGCIVVRILVPELNGQSTKQLER